MTNATSRTAQICRTEANGHRSYKVTGQVQICRTEANGHRSYKATGQAQICWTEASGHRSYKVTGQAQICRTEASGHNGSHASDIYKGTLTPKQNCNFGHCYRDQNTCTGETELLKCPTQTPKLNVILGHWRCR